MFFEPERLPYVQEMILNAEEAQGAPGPAETGPQEMLQSGREDGRALTPERRAELEAELKQVEAEIAASPAVQKYLARWRNSSPTSAPTSTASLRRWTACRLSSA